MSDDYGTLNPYEVTVNGITTVLLLTDHEARARGLSPMDQDSPGPKTRRPTNKSRTPLDKQAGKDAE